MPTPILTSTDLAEWLRVAAPDHAVLTSLAAAATEYCESFTRRALVLRTLTERFDAFAAALPLPCPPLVAVSSVQYVDTAGDVQTAGSSLYEVDTNTEPGIVRLAYAQTWPTARGVANAVRINYSAGYGTVADVPDGIKVAARLLAAHWFEHPMAAGDAAIATAPLGVRSLLWPFRVLV